jgi:hypothetical protein
MCEEAILNTEWFKEKQQPIVEDRIVVSNMHYYGERMDKEWYQYKLWLNTDNIPTNKYEAVKKAIEGVLNNENNMPSIDKAGAIAVEISERVDPKLTAQEQAFFIAGFQECIKWIGLKNKPQLESIPTTERQDMKDNKIELLQEDIECVHKFLDDKKVPRSNWNGKQYSIVGRICVMLENYKPLKVQRQDSKEDKPEYTILDVEYCSERRTLRYDGLYCIYTDGVGMDLKYIIDNGGRIITVQRNSDNEVFTVGEDTDKGIITKFEVQGKEMYVYTVNKIQQWYYLSQINLAPKEEQKPILFTTEDGVEIIDGERMLFYVSQFRIRERKAKNMVHIDNKRFYKKEAAEQYILENKPCLSVKDISQYVWSLSQSMKEIKKLANTKINKQ